MSREYMYINKNSKRKTNTEQRGQGIVTKKSRIPTSFTLFSEASSLVLASMRPSLALSYSFSRLEYFF